MLGMLTKIVTSNMGRLFLMDMGIQWGAFLVANHYQTDKFYDLTGMTPITINLCVTCLCLIA